MILFYIFIFFFGLVVGSFLNVVICRLQTQEGIVKKRSHCPKCGKILCWYDLIPIASFFILRGRCRYCREKISWQYPLVELATGTLFILIALKIFNFKFLILNQFSNFLIFNDFLNLFVICFLLFVICCLIVIFTYDLRHYIIPDKIIFPAIAAALIFRIFSASSFVSPPLNLRGGWGELLLYFISALAAAAFFLAIVLITKGKGMGVGDVKLAFLMGLILGWPSILVALFLAFSGGALVGLGLIAAKQKTLKSQIPFGPFLIGGTLITLFFGSAIISWYFSFFL